MQKMSKNNLSNATINSWSDNKQVIQNMFCMQNVLVTMRCVPYLFHPLILRLARFSDFPTVFANSISGKLKRQTRSYLILVWSRYRRSTHLMMHESPCISLKSETTGDCLHINSKNKRTNFLSIVLMIDAVR